MEQDEVNREVILVRKCSFRPGTVCKIVFVIKRRFAVADQGQAVRWCSGRACHQGSVETVGRGLGYLIRHTHFSQDVTAVCSLY